MPRKTLSTAAIAAAALALAACSGSASGTSSQSGSAAASSFDLGPSQQVVQAALANPTSIGITNKLAKKPPTGKYIVLCGTPTPVAELKDAAFATAAQTLGWRTQRLVEGSGPEDAAKCMTQAVALKPDMILFSGTTISTLKTPLAQASAAHIPVLAETVADPKTGPIIDASIDGPANEANAGKLMANYVAFSSKGKAHVALVNLPLFKILSSYASTFTSTLASVCPGCTITKLDQQGSDIGTKTPSSIVSAIQQDPKINWVVYTVGDLSIGVSPALKAANIKVSIGGNGASQANLAALKAGTETAWTGLSTPILGYRDADMMARYFAGEPLTPGVRPTSCPRRS